MSKHRHSKDKMHITYSEMKQDWQGKKDKKKYPFEKLPFYCCSLSLAPFQDPVCTSQGHVFDILYVMPFIKKYQRNPITGNLLKASDLIKMHWTKNQKNQFEDPISYKVFTEYTHIVCIKTSGYVYAYDTIQQLNKKQKMMNDLVTNEPFTNQDIITIQDPKSQKSRRVQNFDYLKNNIPFVPPDKLQPGMIDNQSVSRIMEQVNFKRKQKQDRAQEEVQTKKKVKKSLQAREDVRGFIDWCIQNKIYQHQRQTDMGSASLTSTNFTPNVKAQTGYRELKETQIRQKIYKQVRKQKMKGLVQIATNLGNINVIVHADIVPKTSQNFIELTEAGYYDKTEFHRLVKDFCLQGGDPTGTGSGGQSIFGPKPFADQFSPKLTHSKPGMLSMANSGSNTNRSQFFITLAQAPHLDNKHSVFGQVISNQTLLYNINKNYANKSGKPKEPIIIQKMFCYDNPFRKIMKKLKQEAQAVALTDKQKQAKDKQRWIISDKEKFKLPQAKNEKKQKDSKNKTNLSNQLLKDYF